MSTRPGHITVESVSRVYQRGPENVQALDRVSVEVTAGELVVLSGPSGSGKSTLLDVVLGWQAADSGTVDVEPAEEPIGVIPQQLALFEELTVVENVSIAADPVDIARISTLLVTLEIDELADRLPHELSLGQQQRVAVARALAIRPAVVVADEPTSHQDAERAFLVMAALRQAADEGAAVLLTSHDPRVTELCDRPVHLSHGRLADAAPRPEAITQPRSSAALPLSPATIRLLFAIVVAIAGIVAMVILTSG